MARSKTYRDLKGQVFGKWRVIRRAANGGPDGTVTRWFCRCACGTTSSVAMGSLTSGNSKSCGCGFRQNTTQVIDLTGQHFGKLFVLERGLAPVGNNYAWWTVRCSCGKIYDVSGGALRGGQISCGCGPARNKRHGQAGHGNRTPAWRSWQSMMQRCVYKLSRKRSRYAGRGITVCKHWRVFEHFFADMGARPHGMTLHRKRNDRNYCKSNCVWATAQVQAKYRSSPPKLRVQIKRLKRRIVFLENALLRARKKCTANRGVS